MWQGKVESIYIASQVAQPVVSMPQVRAVFGKGLEGDRNFDPNGPDSPEHDPEHEVTLIEAEAIEALGRDYGVEIDPGSSRRNIVTRGAPLNHLVGKEFRVGEVTLRGLRLCEPCHHLASLTEPRVLKGLVHRGGLRAQIVRDGVIRVGDVVEERQTAL